MIDDASCGIVARAGHDNDGIAVGRQAPPLLVRDLSLGMDLRQLKLAGRWSVVFFGTTSCEPCVDAMAQLSLALPELSACNVAVIAALNASHEEVQTLIEARSYGFDTYVDPEGASSVAWEVRVTPFALLLGPDERVQAKALLSGEQRVRDFLNVTQRLVQGEAVAEAPVLAGASGPLEL